MGFLPQDGIWLSVLHFGAPAAVKDGCEMSDGVTNTLA